jgi:hypothetical protein
LPTTTKTSKGRYKYEGYLAFRVMAELHAELFPNEKSIDGGSRKAQKIFRAFNKVYTDGVEDTLQRDDEWIAKQRKRIARSCKESETYEPRRG